MTLTFPPSGKKNVRYRSAAEFMPHAEWLCTVEPPARACECRHCPRDKVYENPTQERKGPHRKNNAQHQKSRSSLGRLPRAGGSAISTSAISSQPNRRLRSNTPDPTSTTNPLKKSSLYPSPVDGDQNLLGCVRVAIHQTTPATQGAPIWPTAHELIWCKLQHSVKWTDVTIDFWPGVIKAGPEELDRYLVTLLGSTHDLRFPLHALMPYRLYRVEETVLQKLQSAHKKRARPTLLNLEEYMRVDMDEHRFSTISSAFLFAISFSDHLATAWSWTANQTASSASSASSTSTSRPTRYCLRSQKRGEERFSVLWWGPERIEVRQLVQLKVSTAAIFIDPDILSAPTLATHPTEPDQPVFLQIHSMSYRRKSEKKGDHLTGPVVAGAIFDLVDESQYGTGLHCGPRHHLYLPQGSIKSGITISPLPLPERCSALG